MKVYMVMFDWSTDDDSQVEVELFDTYKKAFDRFEEIIANEMVFDISWAAEAFDVNGDIVEGYEFEEHIDSDGMLVRKRKKVNAISVEKIKTHWNFMLLLALWIFLATKVMPNQPLPTF